MGGWAAKRKVAARQLYLVKPKPKANDIRTPPPARRFFYHHHLSPNTATQLPGGSNLRQLFRQGYFLFDAGILLPETNPGNSLLRSSCVHYHASLLFDEMPQPAGGRLGDATIVRVSRLLKLPTAVTPNALTARTAHGLAIKVGALGHLPIVTSLLTLYSKVAYFGASLALFDEVNEKDVILWNAMITASIGNCCFSHAMELLMKMIEVGHGFDSTTLLLVVSSISYLKNLSSGMNIHGLSIKSGMLSDPNLCNSIVDMYAKCGDVSSSECLFREMKYRDVVSWNSMMTGFLRNGYPEMTLRYLREMAHFGEVADDTTLSCAISASASLGWKSYGEAIHALGLKLGYDHVWHISVANSLISLYSQAADTGAAEAVFTEMRSKDIVSWNTLIDGFGSNGMVWEAFYRFHEMQLSEAVHPDLVTMASLISVCAKSLLLIEGRTLHGYVIRQHRGSDLSIPNSLINMYLKCKQVNKAEILFGTIPTTDLVTWNTMISGYSENGFFKEAQLSFRDLLRHWYSGFSLSTLLAIIPSCSFLGGIQFGKSIHCCHLKTGFSNNTIAVNSLMHMYISCGDFSAALSLLQSIYLIADVDSWNTMIVGCTQNCRFREALKTFNLMRQETSINPDASIYVNVISACGNLELALEGKSIHALSIKTPEGSDQRVQNSFITMYGRCGDIEGARTAFVSSSDHNLCSWNCMISAFSQNKDGRGAIDLFRSINLEPNEITIVGILSACTQIGVLRHGKQIHAYTIRRGFHSNSYLSAALVDMYSNCGRLDTGVQVFSNSGERNVTAWNSMISAHGNNGEGRKAIALFNEMLCSGVVANKSTFVSLLSACGHSGLVDEGMYYYGCMLEKYGVQPTVDHQVYMVDMLGRSGRLEKALDFVMQTEALAEPGIWGALLSACNYHGAVGMGREVADVLFKLEPQNAGYYVSLSNMYVAAGRWKEAVELRNIVEEKKLKKPVGYSSIDVCSM